MPTRKLKKKYRKTKRQMGENVKIPKKLEHPMQPFITTHHDKKYLLVFTNKNQHLVDTENIYIKCFLEKMLEILRSSFNREKEYHKKLGNYHDNYEHSIDTILMNLKKTNYLTFVATDENIVPISYLHIEMRKNDYDKMWTVCTNPKNRGQGYSSFVVKNTLKHQKRNNRRKLLLEVYNDDTIERQGEETRQETIMNHFQNHGFIETNRNNLSSYTRSNLLSDSGETKIMTCNL